jgi:lactate dehydrogenase-like 2-hydroxyacid dehydrogenase
MQVLYSDPSRWEEGEKELGAERVELDELLARSDFVSLHAPLNAQTRHLVGAAAFSRMKDTAILVNTARGGLVDERALCEALVQGRLGGAGLDVFDPEPPDADNPLLGLSQVVLAPHLGSATVSAREAMAALAVDNLLAVLGDRPPLTPVG